jgi:hypothetical protein
MTVVGQNTKFIHIRSRWCLLRRSPVVTFKALTLFQMTEIIYTQRISKFVWYSKIQYY